MAGVKKKVLATFLHLRHPKTQEVHVFAPGDEVPAWAAKEAVNPKLFASDEDQAVKVESKSAPAPKKGGQDEQPAVVDPSKLSFAQLQEQMRANELPATGTQEELAERLAKFLAEQAAEPQE